MTLCWCAIAVALAVVAVIVLITLWMRRPRVDEDVEDEDRWIDHGDETGPGAAGPAAARGAHGPAPAGRRGRGVRELLEDLAPRPGVRREDGETPAEHAGRLREPGPGALGLDLLAADYGLVRFGGVRLSDAEERRAVRRASILRRLLVGRAPGLDERRRLRSRRGRQAGRGCRARRRTGGEVALPRRLNRSSAAPSGRVGHEGWWRGNREFG